MNTRILFVKRPTGWVDPSCFAIDHVAEADVAGTGAFGLIGLFFTQKLSDQHRSRLRHTHRRQNRQHHDRDDDARG